MSTAARRLQRASSQPSTWRSRLSSATLENPRHIYLPGSSSEYGAANWGASPPKWLNSWPGRLRTALSGTGSGMVLANSVTRANPSWDPRFAFGGTITDQALGWHRQGVWRAASGAANYIEFTTPATSFVIYALTQTSGVGYASVDGGAPMSFQMVASGGAATTITRQAGYHNGHCVIVIPAGSLATHTLRIWAEGTVLDVFALESRTGSDRFIVDNASISGRSLASLGFVNAGANDETNGRYGLPMLDTLLKQGPGVCMLALYTNEWTTGTSLAVTESRIRAEIARVLSISGIDPFFYIQPQPNPTLQGGEMTYTDLVALITSIAAEFDIPVLNNQKLFAGTTSNDETTLYNQGNANGYFADTIHPNNNGATLIATTVQAFLGL